MQVSGNLAFTIYVHALDNIKSGVDSGKGCAHEREGNLSALPSKTTRKKWESLRGKNVGASPIDETTDMWNAGVIAITGDKATAVI